MKNNKIKLGIIKNNLGVPLLYNLVVVEFITSYSNPMNNKDMEITR